MKPLVSFLLCASALAAAPLVEAPAGLPLSFSPERAATVVFGRDTSPRRFLSPRIRESNFRVAWSASPRVTQATIFVHGPAVHPAAGGGGPTYLIKQDFEGTGYDNSETWTETGTGTKDEDYATSPAPLDGSQSLHIAASAQTPMTTSPTFTAQSDLWVYFLVNLTSVPGSQQTLFQLRTSSTQLAKIDITSAGLIRASNGGTAANTVSALSATTTYHVWMHYTKGTGANGVTTVGFSTNGIKPTSGNSFVSITTGSANADCDRVVVGTNTSTTFDYIVDKIRVDDATIGDNPS